MNVFKYFAYFNYFQVLAYYVLYGEMIKYVLCNAHSPFWYTETGIMKLKSV